MDHPKPFPENGRGGGGMGKVCTGEQIREEKEFRGATRRERTVTSSCRVSTILSSF
jgi:hypothetical protein